MKCNMAERSERSETHHKVINIFCEHYYAPEQGQLSQHFVRAQQRSPYRRPRSGAGSPHDAERLGQVPSRNRPQPIIMTDTQAVGSQSIPCAAIRPINFGTYCVLAQGRKSVHLRRSLPSATSGLTLFDASTFSSCHRPVFARTHDWCDCREWCC